MKKHWFLMAAAAVCLPVLLFFPQIGRRAVEFSGKSILTFLIRLPPIFILTGLLDLWIDRERMTGIMGRGAGVKGIALSLLLGMVTAVPLYGLFPVAGLLLKKGGRMFHVLLFVCSSASMRFPLLLFEAASLGWPFTLIRLALNLPAVFAISLIIDALARRSGVPQAR